MKTAPVVVPTVDSDVNIVVRQFRPADAPQVHAMLVEGIIYGPESPRNIALRLSLTSRVACLAYIGFVLGLACLFARDGVLMLRVAGVVLCVGAAVLFGCLRRSITRMFIDFCAKARRTDMADINKTYEVPLSEDETQGPGGFWVAAIEALGGTESEVVGYLGLDYGATADPSSGELRRMIVSPHHRRRRIGSLLISAALAHAQRTLATLDLETPEFHTGAQRLYARHGFTVVGSRVMRTGIFATRVLRLRRKLSDV